MDGESFETYLERGHAASRLRGREVLREYCLIQALVYRSMDDYAYASDGFCAECPNGIDKNFAFFRHDGKTIDYIRQAVVEKLHRDRILISEYFDPLTGVYLGTREDER